MFNLRWHTECMKKKLMLNAYSTYECQCQFGLQWLNWVEFQSANPVSKFPASGTTGLFLWYGRLLYNAQMRTRLNNSLNEQQPPTPRNFTSTKCQLTGDLLKMQNGTVGSCYSSLHSHIGAPTEAETDLLEGAGGNLEIRGGTGFPWGVSNRERWTRESPGSRKNYSFIV